ncbi:MAG: hypothetical protein RI964_745 [Pseudomonadota bacterium]|jgi:Na+/proline symporter/nitrogen-specific signal transduction histidine kinase
MSGSLVVAASFAYLLLLFAVAWLGDKRAAAGHSLIASSWVYALSMAVYCTAWTYFGSVGRAASTGVWFLPIYLGPTLAMMLGWLVLRKMIRIAKTYRLTSIADFIASRYGKSPLLAGLVTLITAVGIVPYIALQLKAVAGGYAVLTNLTVNHNAPAQLPWWADSTLYIALVLAGFTIVFGTRHLDNTERHEGMVAAIAFESLIKLAAFLAVGGFVVYGMFNGLSDIFTQAAARTDLQPLLHWSVQHDFAYSQWFALILLSGFAILFLPRQFQIMVVENVDEQHLPRAMWVFPLYLLLINLFVLPIALAGLLWFGHDPTHATNPEYFVLSLPLAQGQTALALLAFIGGLSAATGMVIVETIAVSTMICNDLVMPLLLRTQHFAGRQNLTRLLLGIRRVAIITILLLGYVYFHLAGEAYALVSIGLISFAAVAQFAPAMLGGMYWQGGRKSGVMAGLLAGFALWTYTLMLPSLAKSGWIAADFLQNGLWGIAWLKPEQLFGLQGLDNLTHALFWSLFCNTLLYVSVSLWKAPAARETSQALLFVNVFERTHSSNPVFWQGTATVTALTALLVRFLGAEKSQRLFQQYAVQVGVSQAHEIPADARLVQFVETQLAGAIGTASAHIMVASVVEEEALDIDDVLRILEEASQLRAYSQALEQASSELRAANEQLKSLDRLKDDFMSSVTHELRTPLTSIRALSEMMVDDPDMPWEQRQQFLNIVVNETERLGRLVNQVLDMAKIEAGHAEWHNSDVDMRSVIQQAMDSIMGTYRERGATLTLHAPAQVQAIRADADRLMQVMLNLLSNAVKFVPPAHGQVAVHISDTAEGITVAVQDNGEGIAPAQQALVFEKFRQAGDASHRPQGTGLGLPISRQIVEHFGGKMWLQSSLGQGACFSFFLPRYPNDSSN